MYGQVQGVFFRASTDEVASEHGVVGWITNRADGAVEAWLEGDEEPVRAVEAWMRSGGPPSATVTDVRAEDVGPTGHRHFEVT